MNMFEDSTHYRPLATPRLISPVGVREPREHPVLENLVREAPLLELDLRLEPFELALRLFSCFRDTWRGAERRIERLLDLDLGLGTMSMRTGISRGPSLEILVSLLRQQQMIMTIIITKASTDTPMITISVMVFTPLDFLDAASWGTATFGTADVPIFGVSVVGFTQIFGVCGFGAGSFHHPLNHPLFAEDESVVGFTAGAWFSPC